MDTIWFCFKVLISRKKELNGGLAVLGLFLKLETNRKCLHLELKISSNVKTVL